MNELNKERLLELLSDQATFGLSDEERNELLKLQAEFPEFADDDSFELAAAAFGLTDVEADEQMPEHLKAKLFKGAEEFFETNSKDFEARESEESTVRQVEFEDPKPSITQWLGWVFAAAACIVLFANVWITTPDTNVAGNPDTVKTPAPPPSEAEKRNALLATAGAIKTDWASGQKDIELSGDVVWSDADQKGYMKFKGLPVNDTSKETYQLWIFDETQSEKTPIDGGVFDVTEDGEVIVEIDAKLKVSNPSLFAVTVEKPGGVVVSDRKKIVALGKVEAAVKS